MSSTLQSLRKLKRDERGQVLIEYAMLLIVSTVLGFIILMALGQAVDALYGRLEGEVSKPSHF